jgi:hypothetical protein
MAGREWPVADSTGTRLGPGTLPGPIPFAPGPPPGHQSVVRSGHAQTTITVSRRRSRIMSDDRPIANGFKPVIVPADKAYLSNENLDLSAKHGATPFIPFKSNSTPGEVGSVWERMYGYFTFRRQDFLKHYHVRSNVESTFAMTKAKFQDAVRSKTDVAMKNEVLCKFLCHNIVVVHSAIIELGIDGEFWPDNGEPREVLPMRLKQNGLK